MLSQKEHIKIEGHRGYWYIVDTRNWKNGSAYLLEHETYGDETPCIIIDDDKNILLEDVYNGFLDLEETESCEQLKGETDQ